ncbi:hypothetical protein EVAR_60989_1 [Eumeta japonica]|uniref:Uncharacterized protein n=1 Tax=Eumeta variegata TaxID=151549 RepID=A0A4C1ZRT8_EUMVA|nr:hypothetical protein EVAR_60989_1 [Eumeta japonica]
MRRQYHVLTSLYRSHDTGTEFERDPRLAAEEKGSILQNECVGRRSRRGFLETLKHNLRARVAARPRARIPFERSTYINIDSLLLFALKSDEFLVFILLPRCRASRDGSTFVSRN